MIATVNPDANPNMSAAAIMIFINYYFFVMIIVCKNGLDKSSIVTVGLPE
jgi:hypothetical protein